MDSLEDSLEHFRDVRVEHIRQFLRVCFRGEGFPKRAAALITACTEGQIRCAVFHNGAGIVEFYVPPHPSGNRQPPLLLPAPSIIGSAHTTRASHVC